MFAGQTKLRYFAQEKKTLSDGNRRQKGHGSREGHFVTIQIETKQWELETEDKKTRLSGRQRRQRTRFSRRSALSKPKIYRFLDKLLLVLLRKKVIQWSIKIGARSSSHFLYLLKVFSGNREGFLCQLEKRHIFNLKEEKKRRFHRLSLFMLNKQERQSGEKNLITWEDDLRVELTVARHKTGEKNEGTGTKGTVTVL